MSSPESDMQTMHGLLCRHQWTDVADWGRAITALADLSEPDIDRLVGAGGDDSGPGVGSPPPAAAAISG